MTVTLRDPKAENQVTNFDSYLKSAFGEAKPDGPIGIFSAEQP